MQHIRIKVQYEFDRKKERAWKRREKADAALRVGRAFHASGVVDIPGPAEQLPAYSH
jgi:hypothetical protein